MAVRRRVGLLVPATNSTGEPDFHMTVPEGVTVHSHHVWNSMDGSTERATDLMNSDLANGARHLAPLGIEVICMAGTTNSFYKGLSGSEWMEQEMSKAAGVPAGASIPRKSVTSKPGATVSAIVGTPGSRSDRFQGGGKAVTCLIESDGESYDIMTPWNPEETRAW